jgi:sarcosine oxidase subunit beta
VSFLDGEELASRWPELESADVARAAIASDAGYAAPANYTRETAQFAISEGAALRTGTPVELDGEGRVDGDRYDAVVVSAGAHTARLLDMAGHAIPAKAYRVQALLTEPTTLSDAVPMLYDATGGYYLRPRDGRLFVGDGTVPEEHDPTDWEDSADGWFRENCTGYLETALGESVPEWRSWAGLCTATPDGDPLVGECVPGLYVATGFQGHGFMRAPAIGERLAAEVLGAEGIDGFDPGRFRGDESFEIVEGMTLED